MTTVINTFFALSLLGIGVVACAPAFLYGKKRLQPMWLEIKHFVMSLFYRTHP